MAPAVIAAVTVASTAYQINRGMHNERILERDRRDQQADRIRREDQLSNEAKAKAAKEEEMKTAGQRAGAQYGFNGQQTSFFGGGGQNFMSAFNTMAPTRAVEDNIGRGSLYGN